MVFVWDLLKGEELWLGVGVVVGRLVLELDRLAASEIVVAGEGVACDLGGCWGSVCVVPWIAVVGSCRFAFVELALGGEIGIEDEIVASGFDDVDSEGWREVEDVVGDEGDEEHQVVTGVESGVEIVRVQAVPQVERCSYPFVAVSLPGLSAKPLRMAEDISYKLLVVEPSLQHRWQGVDSVQKRDPMHLYLWLLAFHLPSQLS